MSSTNPIVTITSTLDYAVDIYDVFKPNASTSTAAPLKYTKLATVPGGATGQQVQTINFASQLQAMRTGNIEALNNNYYRQFPVAVLPVSGFADSYLFTLTSDMQQGMEQSFKFIKYAQANAPSQIATNFRTALGDKTSQKDAVNAFFKSTASFQNCTLSTWTAVLSWQSQFTDPWQGTFYLYSAGSNSTPALVATLAITASADSSSSKLTLANSSNQNTAVAMVGDGTMQEQDPGSGPISVALIPVWVNINQTNQDKTVTSVIAAAFAGTINGTNVAGNLNQLKIPDSSSSSSDDKENRNLASFYIGIFSEVFSTLGSLGMFFMMYLQHKQSNTQKKNDVEKSASDKADADAKKAEVNEKYQQDDIPAVNKNSANLENNVVPEVQIGYDSANQADQISSNMSSVRQVEEKIGDALELGAASPEIEAAAQSVQEARVANNNAMDGSKSVEERRAELDVVKTKLTDTNANVDAVLQNEENQLDEDVKQDLEATQDVLAKQEEQRDAIQNNEEEQKEENAKENGDTVNEDQFENPEVDPVVE
jgi:hypothetical protein